MTEFIKVPQLLLYYNGQLINTYPSSTPTAHVSTSAHVASTTAAPSAHLPTAAAASASAHAVHVLLAHGLLDVHMLAFDLVFAL